MKEVHLQLPLNFDRRADVTLFTRRLNRLDCAFLLWLEWANERKEWRPIKATDRERIEWSVEDITFLLTSFVRWEGAPTEFMTAAVASGMLRVEERDSRLGLVLNDFAATNPELVPTYQSAAAKGGAARAVKNHKSEAHRISRQMRRIREARQQELILTDGVTAQQHEAAIALILRIDRACGMEARKEFDDDLVDLAVPAAANTKAETIDAVLAWLIGQRQNPEIVTRTDRVLRDWAGHVERVAPPQMHNA